MRTYAELDHEDDTPYDPAVDLTEAEMDELLGDGTDYPNPDYDDDGEYDEPDPGLSPSCSFES